MQLQWVQIECYNYDILRNYNSKQKKSIEYTLKEIRWESNHVTTKESSKRGKKRQKKDIRYTENNLQNSNSKSLPINLNKNGFNSPIKRKSWLIGLKKYIQQYAVYKILTLYLMTYIGSKWTDRKRYTNANHIQKRAEMLILTLDKIDFKLETTIRDNDFLDMTLKVHSAKAKTDKWGSNNLKKFCESKDSHKKAT